MRNPIATRISVLVFNRVLVAWEKAAGISRAGPVALTKESNKGESGYRGKLTTDPAHIMDINIEQTWLGGKLNYTRSEQGAR